MMNPELINWVSGLMIGGLAGIFLTMLIWFWNHLRRGEEIRELQDVLEQNFSSLFNDQPLRTVRRRRDVQPIAAILDRWLPRLRAEHSDALRQMRQLRIVLESMTEGVVAVDSRLRLILANPAAQPLLGIEKSSLGLLLPEVIRNPKLLEYVSNALEQATSVEAEIPLSLRDSMARPQQRLVEVRIAPILRRLEKDRPSTSPSVAGAVLVVQDVTELRRLERMRQDFVTNASHELKTPLASIKLYAESLGDWALEDPHHNREFLARIEEQTERLINLVSDMLSLSRLESGQDAMQHTPSAIEPQLRSRVASYQDKAVSNQVHLELFVHDIPIELKVIAAEEAIRQVLDNLIDNAVKYTPSGGKVEVHALLRSEEQLEIRVSDTGIGIPRSDLERVFERFYRVDKARSRDMGGTGLGLAIVKHLIHSIGGEIGVESRESLGSTFWFTLPVDKGSDLTQTPDQT
ncbi:MAG: hypothetical protein RJA81_1205 [Planctomycetota bacterium]|jgi:two-component system phosphate regulon sensor histidine kinase PhoR